MVSLAPCPAGLFLDPRERALTNLDFSQGAKDANSCRGKPKPLMLRHSRSEWRGVDPTAAPRQQRGGEAPAPQIKVTLRAGGGKGGGGVIFAPEGLGRGGRRGGRPPPPQRRP